MFINQSLNHHPAQSHQFWAKIAMRGPRKRKTIVSHFFKYISTIHIINNKYFIGKIQCINFISIICLEFSLQLMKAENCSYYEKAVSFNNE